MRRNFLLLTVAIFFSLGLQAADVTGIWMGQMAGRNGEKQDVAFRFKVGSGAAVGTMFGDEFDVPVSGLTVSGDRISFSTTSTNYYDGSKIRHKFSGTVTGNQIELTRERVDPEPVEAGAQRKDLKQTFTLKKIS